MSVVAGPSAADLGRVAFERRVRVKRAVVEQVRVPAPVRTVLEVVDPGGEGACRIRSRPDARASARRNIII